MSGNLNIFDPGSLVGGDQVLDLSTLANSTVNFSGATLSQAGNVVTVTTDYSFAQTFNLDGNNFLLDVNGTIVATGIVSIPEAGGSLALMMLAGLFTTRRKRVVAT